MNGLQVGGADLSDDGLRPVEIRVHGIGDHEGWSSMGSPQVLVDGKSGTSLVAPPRRPEHRVLLFNWSRVTRRVFRALWYLAFPFTLLNVAHQMQPNGPRWVRVLQVVFVRLSSLAL